jgi:type III restriction enzyme
MDSQILQWNQYLKTNCRKFRNIWALQIEWLIHRHFTSLKKLTKKYKMFVSYWTGCQIIWVETPIINIFLTNKAIYPMYNGGNSSIEHSRYSRILFLHKASGEFADNEGG